MADEEIQEQMATLSKKIETKFKMLDIKEKESARILERRKIRELEKHANEIETRVGEIQDLKGKVQEHQLESEKEIDEIDKWTNEIDGKLEKYDQPLENIQNISHLQLPYRQAFCTQQQTIQQ